MCPEGLPTGIVGPADRLVMVVGNFGSGKTEVAVNLAIGLSRTGRRVQIADLDIVNPYFRCREARQLMEEHAIRVVVPPGAQAYADLPIILPEIAGMLRPPGGTTSIFDVGGDDVGAKVLSSLQPSIPEGGYQLWQVINSRRPFTGTVEGCIAMQRAVEKASRLRVTGLIANSHLIEETTPETILEGWRLACRVSEETGLPVRCAAVMEQWASAPELEEIEAPVLMMRRYMLPPWIEPADSGPLPAARPVPIGKPGPIRTGKRQGDGNGKNRD
jgi:hypothetical protein